MGMLIPAPIAMEEAEEILERKLRWILEASDPLAVIAFGSVARSEMTERSDIDIALIFSDEEALKSSRKSIYRRPPPDSWPLDMLFYTKDDFLRKRESGGVCELIAREGRLIHGGIE